ncbi:phosphodiester glycosidase family protein [uncultured Methanobrevibacter sp.]|uniref:phosphodiester glycosidase family protein n=1 Tax=uncultured Methanobrevibacter sp. TaxID=253161 RepID=UPI0026171AFF|nr:phosphodiester glycosidase family protein [uncultured Methanobrevibacter sp.]
MAEMKRLIIGDGEFEIVDEAARNNLSNIHNSVFYKNIVYETYRTKDTDCYVITIPYKDEDGNVINPYMAYSETETPAEYARNHGTTFTSNGAANMLKTDGTWQVPITFSRGEKIYGTEWTGTPVPNDARIVSFNQDRTITEFPVDAKLSDLVSGGAYNTVSVYYKLVENSAVLDLSEVVVNEDGRVTDKNPNLAVGVKSDKTIVFFVCDGRTNINKGLDSIETAEQMVSFGCTDAWMMDGGGSASVNYKGSKLNRNIDGDGTIDRKIRFTFNVKKDVSNDVATEAFGKIGEEKQNIIKQIIPLTKDIYRINGFASGTEVLEEGTDLNNIIAVGRYEANPNSLAATIENCPTSVAFVMTVEYLAGTSEFFYTIKDYYGNIFVRRNHIYSGANHFTDWEHVVFESKQDIKFGSVDLSISVNANSFAYDIDVPVSGLTSDYKVVCTPQWAMVYVGIRSITTDKFKIDVKNLSDTAITSLRLHYICVK